MSDEEKKAIKEVKHFKELTRYWQEEEYEEKEIAGYIEIILNLIEKQSKEIEDNKKYIVQLTDEQYRKLVDIIRSEKSKEWEDKIKAKIEEIDFMIKEINQGNLQKYTVGELLGAKRFLESLLEKE